MVPDMPGGDAFDHVAEGKLCLELQGGGREFWVAGVSLQSDHRTQVGLAATQDANIGLDIVIGRGAAAAAADLTASGRRAAGTNVPEYQLAPPSPPGN